MATNREQVLALLREYREVQQKIKILRHEQKYTAEISAEEVMEGLALRPPQSSGLPSDKHTSDKTMWIATEYREITRRLNDEQKCSITGELLDLLLEHERLEHYVELLPEEHREIIRLHYLEGMSWLQVQQQLKKAKRTLTGISARAIDMLTEMYAYVDILVNAPSEASAPTFDLVKDMPTP